MKRKTHISKLPIIALMVLAGAVATRAQDGASEPAGPEIGKPVPSFETLVDDLSATILKYSGFE